MSDPLEAECVGCVVEIHPGAPQAGEWIPDPTCPVHGDPRILQQIAREAAERPQLFPAHGVEVLLTALNPPPTDGPPFTHQIGPAPVVEGRVVGRQHDDTDAITLEQLVNGLVRWVEQHPETAGMPVGVANHCCWELLTGKEPSVQNLNYGPGGRFVMLYGEGEK